MYLTHICPVAYLPHLPYARLRNGAEMLLIQCLMPVDFTAVGKCLLLSKMRNALLTMPHGHMVQIAGSGTLKQ